MKNKLRFAFPKGSLQVATQEKMKKAGWDIVIGNRNYSPKVDRDNFDCALLRPQKFPLYINSNRFDLAVTGYDCIVNYLASIGKTIEETNIQIVTRLVFSKRTSKKSRWKIIVRKDSGINSINDLEGKTVTTEMVDIAKQFFREKGINVKIEFSWGGAEAEVLHKMVDAAVDISETNETINSNKELTVLDEVILETDTVLIASKKSINNQGKKCEIRKMAVLLQSVLLAEKKVWLSMNVLKEDLEKVKSILPTMKQPDEIELSTGWIKLRSLVNKGEVTNLFVELLDAGADDIVEDIAPNKVFSQSDLGLICI